MSQICNVVQPHHAPYFGGHDVSCESLTWRLLA